jgi:hypothetical protein
MKNKDLTFRVVDFVGSHLKNHAETRFTSRQLAEALIDAHPEEANAKRSASSRDLSGEKLVPQIQAEITSNKKGIQKKFANAIVTTDRPCFFYWSDLLTVDPVLDADDSPPAASIASGLLEAALYPLVRDFIADEKSVYCMRIDEKTSSGKGGAGSSHWLHPDLVGIQLLSEGWSSQAESLSRYYNPELIKLWSFEVKRSLSTANVRSSYFQAVSNSSWAHFGYLVAETIDQRVWNELEVLSSAHGIGVIQLNSQEPERSIILIPASERLALSWTGINRIAEENRDFADFLRGLERLHQTHDIKLVAKTFDASFK